MDNTILVIGFLVSSLGISTIIGFIAKIWFKTETHDKDLQRVEKDLQNLKEKENKDFEELKKKNELVSLAVAKLETLPSDIKDIKHDIRNLVTAFNATVK
jgi:uncharacterized membrane protein (DUF106 family)